MSWLCNVWYDDFLPFLCSHIGEINTWLDEQLSVQPTSSAPSKEEKVQDDPKEKQIRFVVPSENKVTSDEYKLTLKSHSTFVTVKANAGVVKGKWMYEVQLHSKVNASFM